MEQGFVRWTTRLAGLAVAVAASVWANDSLPRRPTGRRVPLAPGAQIAFSSNSNGNRDIYAMVIDGSGLRRLTTYDDDDGYPCWSPDGERIAFYAYHGTETWSIYTMRADGSERRRLTHREGAQDYAPQWSPDGQHIAFSSYDEGRDEIWVMNANGSNQRRLDGVAGSGPRWSPDGSRFTFASNHDGNTDIYLMNVDGTDVQQLTFGEERDLWPSWSPDG